MTITGNLSRVQISSQGKRDQLQHSDGCILFLYLSPRELDAIVSLHCRSVEKNSGKGVHATIGYLQWDRVFVIEGLVPPV